MYFSQPDRPQVVTNPTYISSDKEKQKNHEAYNMELISEFTYSGPHGLRYRQAVRSIILSGITILTASRIRALWTTVSNPQIRSLFKTTWLAQKASHVVSSRGAGI